MRSSKVLLLSAVSLLVAALAVTPPDAAAMVTRAPAALETAKQAPLPASERAAASSSRELGRLEILDLVQARDFQPVEDFLVELQHRFERNPNRQTEDQVVRAFLSFNSTRRGLGGRLKRWRVEMPGSFAARVASGNYRLHLASIARGNRSRNATREMRVARVRRHVTVARRHFESGIAIDSQVTSAWSGLITLAMLSGDRGRRDATLSRALQSTPYSFEVRGTYLLALQPKWGGSSQAMNAFIDSSRSAIGTDDYALLAAYLDVVQADGLAAAGRYAEAKQIYDRALRAGEHWRFLLGRGTCYRQLYELDAALADLNRALELRPQAKALLEERASIYRKMTKPSEALTDLDLALALDPRDPSLLNERAWLLLATFHRADEALRDAEDLIVLGSARSEAWGTYGSVLLWGKKDAEGARRAFERAIALSPRNADAWFGYGQALYTQRKSSSLDAFDRYAYLCSHGQPCDEDDEGWIRAFVHQPGPYFTWPRILLKWRLLSQLL